LGTPIEDQLDRADLDHNTFTPEALALIVRSGIGAKRKYTFDVKDTAATEHIFL